MKTTCKQDGIRLDVNHKQTDLRLEKLLTCREKTKSRKALVSTFITTFGVANGVHKSIGDSEVTMDGLFGS